MTVHEQPFFTKTDGAEPGIANPQVDQVFLGTQSPTLAQSHIVFTGSTGIAITLDADVGVSLAAQKLGVSFYSGYLIRANIGGIEIEVDRQQTLGCPAF